MGSAVRYSQRSGRRTGLVHDLRRRDAMTEDIGRVAGLDFEEWKRKPPFIGRGARKEHFKRGFDSLLRSGWPGDHEWALTPGDQLGIKQKEWQSAEMIAVKMRQDDPVDAAEIEPTRLERDRR